MLVAVIQAIWDIILLCVITVVCILISFPSLYLFRTIARDTAFEGFSKSRIKKVWDPQPFKNKLSLLFLLEYRGSWEMKRALIVYYLYWCVVVALILLTWFRTLEIVPAIVSTRFFGWKTLFDVGCGYYYQVRAGRRSKQKRRH